MPRRSRSKAKNLTPRDQAILADLARCRVLSLEQIHAAHWPKARTRTCQERLNQLAKAGYIKAYTIDAEKPGVTLTIYSLDKRGKQWASGPSGPGLDRKHIFTGPEKLSEAIHQIRANEVYFHLSEAEKATWRIGDVLELEHNTRVRDSPKIPDAVYTAADGEKVYVECDTGSYTAAQVKDKLKGFSAQRIIWVCPRRRKKILVHYGVNGQFITY